VVPKVVSGSPGKKTGIRQGDMILKINGKAVKSPQQLKGDSGR
jgi:S1-C subfamily serine protease